MTDERATPPIRKLARAPTAREIAAWLELVGCDGDLERMLERVAAVRVDLDLTAPAAELDTALGCLAEHLHPAREVVRRFEETYFPGERAEWVAAWARRLRDDRAAGHERCRGFLADLRSEALPALRHLLTCPLCERLARLLLFGFLPGIAERPARRRKPSTERQLPRGERG